MRRCVQSRFPTAERAFVHAEVFRKFGGIHPFMKWDGAVLTDSGGFQIFSLSLTLQTITVESALRVSAPDVATVMGTLPTSTPFLYQCGAA